MSASTVSITANPTAATRRTPILAGEKKSNFDYPQSESLANDGTTTKDQIRSETILDRSNGQDLGPITRRSNGSTATGATTTTQRKTRKVEKPKTVPWKRVVRVFAKQLMVLLLIVGLIQVIRKVMVLTTRDSYSSSFETEMAFSGLERRIAEVDGFVKSTTSSMQVQVELLDKKIDREGRLLREEVEREGKLLRSEVEEVEARTVVLEKSVEEVKGGAWVSREELERVYEELKKGNDVGLSDVGIDELRVYARGVMEKEIERHAADGLGRVDYALGSGGGFVVEHSDPFVVGKGSGWFASGSRRVHGNAGKMLSPSFGEPGQCFALKGSDGFVQIRLRGPIVPEAFTLEHVDKSVAYDRSSAPKDCQVSGWLQGKGQDSLDEAEKIQRLAEFTYDLDRSNAQTFNILDSSRAGLIDTVRLDFTSNHGSNSHTCIYRFRVHGRAPDPVSVVMSQSDQ